MWGKRQGDDDWDGDRRDQSEDNRERRPDRRGNGFWDDSSDWADNGVPASNGNRQGYGDGPGFGDVDRRGFGDSSWAEPQPPRRGRAGGDPGYGEPGYGEPGYGGPGYGEPGYGDSNFADPGYGDPGYGDPGYSGPRHADPRQGDHWQPDSRQQDSWQPESRSSDLRHGDVRQGDPRPGDVRRPMRDFPDAGFGQPGYGGRGGGDRRDLDRRDGGSRGDAGDWGPPEQDKPVPVFTPTVQVPAGAPGPAVAVGPFGGPSGSSGTRPYGRLSIFTLHDDKTAEFDRLAEQAAEGVRMLEPDTLVFVMHVVPKAPMQRIIYEIYRDTAAFEMHQRQPHIQQFEEGRRPCVLVTNIIDLRLKYAKVSPIQGVGQASSSQPAPAPGARHRAPKSSDLDGNGWHGEQSGGRPGDLEAERSFDPLDRRSQDWGQSQYTGQRYRDN